jgi:hypothetical protein
MSGKSLESATNTGFVEKSFSMPNKLCDFDAHVYVKRTNSKEDVRFTHISVRDVHKAQKWRYASRGPNACRA